MGDPCSLFPKELLAALPSLGEFILSPDQHEAADLQDMQTSFLSTVGWNQGQGDAFFPSFFQGHKFLLSKGTCCQPAPATPVLNLLPVFLIVASLAPAVSVALTLFLIKLKYTCEPQDNGVSVCLHSGFHSGRVLNKQTGTTQQLCDTEAAVQ